MEEKQKNKEQGKEEECKSCSRASKTSKIRTKRSGRLVEGRKKRK